MSHHSKTPSDPQLAERIAKLEKRDHRVEHVFRRILHLLEQFIAALSILVLVAALCALIRENGGFDALLYLIRKIFRGKKNGQLGMGLLVGAMDIATANNTVAIVMANPIAKEMSIEYGIPAATSTPKPSTTPDLNPEITPRPTMPVVTSAPEFTDGRVIVSQ